jgi:hypothetical protein
MPDHFQSAKSTASRTEHDVLGIKKEAEIMTNKVLDELRGPSALRVFNPYRKGGTTYPEMYFLASGELLVFMIGVSALITFIVQPISMQCYDGDKLKPNCNTSTLDDNAIRRRIGHNNPCVYFDTPPAKYFASVMYVLCAYCGIRYTWLDLERSILLRDRTQSRLTSFQFWFSAVTDVNYALSWMVFILTYVIPPWQNIWGHSAGFMYLGISHGLVVAANVYEAENVSKIVYLFTAFYFIITILEFGLVAAGNFIYYERTGGVNGPLVPSLYGAIIDYGWFATLGCVSGMMPTSEGLERNVAIAGEVIGKKGDEEENYHLFAPYFWKQTSN